MSFEYKRPCVLPTKRATPVARRPPMLGNADLLWLAVRAPLKTIASAVMTAMPTTAPYYYMLVAFCIDNWIDYMPRYAFERYNTDVLWIHTLHSMYLNQRCCWYDRLPSVVTVAVLDVLNRMYDEPYYKTVSSLLYFTITTYTFSVSCPFHG